MPNIGSLTVELDLQTQQYEAGLKRSKQQIIEHADSLTSLQRTAQQTSNNLTAASDEIVAAWGKSGDAAQDAIKKMESIARSSAVSSGIRAMKTSTDEIVKGWGKVGESGEEAGKRLDFSMREANATLRGIEQLIGVHIPKALEHVITESALLGPALAGALSGIAVLQFIGLLQQLPELFKKLETAVSGWDKKAQEAFKKQTDSLVDLQKKLNDYEAVLFKIQGIGLGPTKAPLFVQAEAFHDIYLMNQTIADFEKRLGNVDAEIKKIEDDWRAQAELAKAAGGEVTIQAEAGLAALRGQSGEINKTINVLKDARDVMLRDLPLTIAQTTEAVKKAREEAAKFFQAFQDALNPAAALNKEMDKIGSTIKGISQEFTNPKGLLQIGNLDLLTRPLVKNLDGSISTVRSLSASFEGLGEVLIPTVSELGMLMDEAEAIAEFQRTGKHLGIFDTPEHATAYALALHKQQEALYGNLAVNEKYNDVIAVYAEKIVAAAKLTKEHGKEVTGLTAVLLPGATAYLEYNKALNAYIEAQVKAAAIVRENKAQALNAPLGGLPTVFTTPGTFPLPTTPITPIDTSQLTQASVALQDLFTKMQQTKVATQDLSEEIRVLSSIGYDDSQIMGMLGDELSNAAKFSKELGITLPENVQHLLDALNAIKQQEISREFASRMTRDFATFVDHIGNDFQNVWRSFESLGINAIDSITSYAKKMKDAGNSVGGILGFIGNNSTLITAGIGGLDLGLSIGRKIGQGRKEADVFGADVLKPFQDQVGGILSLLQQSAKAGTLTTEVLTQAQENFEKGWQSVIDDAAKTNTAVGRQAIEYLTPIVNKWRVAIGSFADSAMQADQATAALTAELDAMAKRQKAIADTTSNIIDKILNPAGDIKPMEGALENLSGVNRDQIIGAVGDDIRRIGDALTEADRPIPPMIKDLYDYIKAQDATHAVMTETKSILDKIANPAGDISAILGALDGLSGTDPATLFKAIGPDIIRIGDAFKAADMPMPPLIQHLYDFGKAQDAINAVATETQSIRDKIQNPAGDITAFVGALENLSDIDPATLIRAIGPDIRRIGDAFKEADLPMPPLIQHLYDFAEAQDAINAVTTETNSILDKIENPAGDITSFVTALEGLQNIDPATLLKAVGPDIRRIGDAFIAAGKPMPTVIQHLYDFAKAQDAVTAATSRITDINDELTSVYDDLGGALNRQLDRLDAEKASLEGQIINAENEYAKSQLQDTLDTTSDLGEYIRTQAALHELDRKMKADKKKTDLEDIQRMKDRLKAVTDLQDATNTALDTLGIKRSHENDLMDSSITALIERGNKLEEERKALAKVAGATELVTNTFSNLLDIFYPFMEPPALKSYQHGTDFVPSTGAYLLHQGESVTPAGQKPRGGGDVTVNFNAPVIGDMDELVDRLSPALLEAHRYDVQYGSQRPAIRQRAARSNRW